MCTTRAKSSSAFARTPIRARHHLYQESERLARSRADDQNIGSHMGFDATRKLPGEDYHRVARAAEDDRRSASVGG